MPSKISMACLLSEGPAGTVRVRVRVSHGYIIAGKVMWDWLRMMMGRRIEIAEVIQVDY